MVTLLVNNNSKTEPAEALSQKIRTDLIEISEKIRNHPYLDALERGQLSEVALRSFIGNQYHLMVSIIRADAQMLQRFGGSQFGDYFYGMLQTEMAAYCALLTLAQKLGMEQAALEDFEIDPDAFAYGCYVSWLADNGSPAEIIGGLGVNFPVWGANCQRMSTALRKHYGFSASQTRFLDIFSEQPEDKETMLDAIDFDLSHQIPGERIARAARLIQAYELRFWDAMAWAASVQ